MEGENFLCGEGFGNPRTALVRTPGRCRHGRWALVEAIGKGVPVVVIPLVSTKPLERGAASVGNQRAAQSMSATMLSIGLA